MAKSPGGTVTQAENHFYKYPVLFPSVLLTQGAWLGGLAPTPPPAHLQLDAPHIGLDVPFLRTASWPAADPPRSRHLHPPPGPVPCLSARRGLPGEAGAWCWNGASRTERFHFRICLPVILGLDKPEGSGVFVYSASKSGETREGSPWGLMSANTCSELGEPSPQGF